MADRQLTVWRSAPGQAEGVLCRGLLDDDTHVVTFTEMAGFRLPDPMPLDDLLGFIANASQSGIAFRVTADEATLWPPDPNEIEG